MGDINYELNPFVMQLLEDLQDFRRGQTLDVVKNDATILSGISKKVLVQQAICVKFIMMTGLTDHDPGEKGADENEMNNIDLDEWGEFNEDEEPCPEERDAMEKMIKIDYDEIDEYTFVATFKIYADTDFIMLKQAACKYWDISTNHEYFILTDEYFNNLATYKDTIQNFFDIQNDYKTLDADVYASVYLMRKNTKLQKLHYLQYESIEIIDENKKDDENEEIQDGSSSDNENTIAMGIPQKIDLKEIADTVVGLETYGVQCTKEKVKMYMEMTEAYNKPNISIWIFFCSFGLFIFNYYGKILKNAPI